MEDSDACSYEIIIPSFRNDLGYKVPEQRIKLKDVSLDNLEWKSVNYDDLIKGLNDLTQNIYDAVRIPKELIDELE